MSICTLKPADWLQTTWFPNSEDICFQQHDIIHVSEARYYPHVSSTTICTQVKVSNLHTRYSPLLSHGPCEDGPIGQKHVAQSTVCCHPHLFWSCVDFRLHEYCLQGQRCNNVTCKNHYFRDTTAQLRP